jgi:hypothetical protein
MDSTIMERQRLMATGLNRRRARVGLRYAPGERSRLRLAHQLRRRPGQRTCEHIDAIDQPVNPRADACEECGVQASLRLCLSCGHVGCCDSSSGHATAHARKTGHPVIRALPHRLIYCYLHRQYF